ncbi:MAG TPA: hypothetical protein VKA32_06495 [Gammaproteobacteria bacterium]|nr:hypothetical protein [Gammaproteobacteria bacterium]
MDAASEAKALDARMGRLFRALPETGRGFRQLVGAATVDGAAVKAGVTRDHVLETLALAVEMGGGPAVVYGARALEAYEGLAE